MAWGSPWGEGSWGQASREQDDFSVFPSPPPAATTQVQVLVIVMEIDMERP